MLLAIRNDERFQERFRKTTWLEWCDLVPCFVTGFGSGPQQAALSEGSFPAGTRLSDSGTSDADFLKILLCAFSYISIVDFDGNLYYTEVPTPGVGGGANRVVRLNANRKKSVVVSACDPNPCNLTSDLFGNVYWTCTSANVIVRRTQFGAGATSVLLRGLKSPFGIDVPLILPNVIYFTEVPTPGLPGSSEGKNNVSVAIKLFSSYLQFQLSGRRTRTRRCCSRLGWNCLLDVPHGRSHSPRPKRIKQFRRIIAFDLKAGRFKS